MFKVVLEYEIEFTALPKSGPRVGQLRSWEAQTRSMLQQEPGAVKYPIRWTSERQRRAFFATKGFGRGIPTRRTGKLAKAWVVEVDFKGLSRFQEFVDQVLDFLAYLDPTGKAKNLAFLPEAVIITIDNPAQAERYVTGIQQQGFHKDIGWIYAPPLIEKAVQQAEHILGVEW